MGDFHGVDDFRTGLAEGRTPNPTTLHSPYIVLIVFIYIYIYLYFMYIYIHTHTLYTEVISIVDPTKHQVPY